MPDADSHRLPRAAFDRERLVTSAMEATGFDHLGEASWAEGLDRLLDSLATEARLSELGVTMVEAEVGAYLRNRLGIVAHRHAHPRVTDREIRRPLVIVGGRGSTSLTTGRPTARSRLREQPSWAAVLPPVSSCHVRSQERRNHGLKVQGIQACKKDGYRKKYDQCSEKDQQQAMYWIANCFKI